MNTKTTPYRWFILLLLVLGTAVLNYSNIIFAVRATDIMDSYHCNATQLAAIVSISSLPGALLSVFFGRILDKTGCKKIMSVFILLTAVVFYLRTVVNSYWALFVLTLLAGIFLVPTGVAPAKVLYSWFDEKEMPVAMGIYASSAGFGSAIGYATSTLFPQVKGSLMLVTLIAAGLFLLWALFGKNAPDAAAETRPAEEKADSAVLKALLKSRNLWILMICSFIASGVSLTLNTYLSRALEFKGGADGAAAVAVIGSVLNICMVLGAAVVGALISKLQLFNKPFLVLCVVGSGMLLVAWFIPFGVVTYIAFPLAALLLSGAVGLNMTRITLLPMTGDLTPDTIATANGLCNMALSLGAFILPIVVSAIAGEKYVIVFVTAFLLFVFSGIIGTRVPELGARGELYRSLHSGSSEQS